jgi:uncharacterized protein (TIGR02996 family)
VSSTRSETRSRDGRFVLRYRCKDSWGDHSYTEEHWRLVDARFGCTVAAWSNEGEPTFESVDFTFTKKAVRVRHCDGRKELFALATPRKLEPVERALRDAVFAEPDDDAPRSVYADWLLQHGLPRGDLIAAQLHGHDVDALLARHRFAFLVDDGLPQTHDATFVRGFVEELRLQVLEPGSLENLLAEPAIACLRRLDLSFSIGGDQAVTQLAQSPRLSRVRRLDLFCSGMTDAGIAALATAHNLPALEHVTLGAHKATEPALAALHAARPAITID